MFKNCLRLFFLTNISLLTLMGCVSSQLAIKPPITQTTQQRSDQLLQLQQWSTRGKIAFIQQIKGEKERRESASLAWQVDEKNKTQTLNLTSYLGINVLSLSSNKDQHRLKVDGEQYSSDNLTQLIYKLTGLTLPTEALTFWVKGLPYQHSDNVIFNSENNLPTSMTSYYHGDYWHITYDQYQLFNQLPMATKFTLKKDGLTIKMALKHWDFSKQVN